jgi:hypothetical protein
VAGIFYNHVGVVIERVKYRVCQQRLKAVWGGVRSGYGAQYYDGLDMLCIDGNVYQSGEFKELFLCGILREFDN